MSEGPSGAPVWHCVFCRMPTAVKLFGLPVCHICRDQVQDFVWASSIQGGLALFGILTGFQFLLEELLLFGILVAVKHRLPRFFDRFTTGGQP